MSTYLGTFLVVTWGWGDSAAGIQWVEARDATTHPAAHPAAPTAESDLAPNVNRAKAETYRYRQSPVRRDRPVVWTPLYREPYADDRLRTLVPTPGTCEWRTHWAISGIWMSYYPYMLSSAQHNPEIYAELPGVGEKLNS